MKALLLGILLVSATVIALPPAEARQACVWPSTDPCDEYLVCVWNRLTRQWECFFEVHCPYDCHRP